MEYNDYIVGYARTSTKEQNIENQISELKKKGVKPENIYYDENVSGSIPTEKRPGFKKLRKYLNDNPNIHTLYMFEISRLGRTFLETLNLVYDLEMEGTQVVSLSSNEQWSTIQDSSFRQFLISIFSWVAENEKKALQERVKIGLEEAKNQGKKLGRPPKEPDKEAVMDLKKRGYTWAKISRKLDIPTSTLYKYKDIWEEKDKLKRVEQTKCD